MRYSLFAGLLVVAGVNCRATSKTNHVQTGSETVERLHNVPRGWNEVGAPSGDRKMRFRIAVRSENPELLERTLIEVSSPNHPRYGKYLKRAELKDIVKPRADSTAAVLNWLEASGVQTRHIQNDGEWISFFAPVKRAEEMMDTTFKTYQSDVNPRIKKVRSLSYSVPKEVRRHIDMIQPTIRFGHIRAARSSLHSQEEVPFSIAAVNTTQCNSTITPMCLAELYNFANYTVDPKSPITLGVNGFLNQYARYADFDQFAQTYAPNAVGANFSFTSVNGGILDQNSTKDSGEANLDIQYTAGLVSPYIKTNFYSTPGNAPLVPDLDQPNATNSDNEPYLDFFTYLVGLDDKDLPQVLSTSYGEDEQSLPVEYARNVCNMIGQLGARGVSVIFSSGDTGVGSGCQSNDGKNTTRFLPIFPAACPYVTSVGATTNIQPEQAVDFSSGGFSDIFARPKYQDEAIAGYAKQLGNRYQGLYNPNGRGFPDVAAQGESFRVFDKGAETLISGTSASAPVFASIIALLNNARLASGMPTMGFLNPWLYEKGYKGLTDIKNGGSSGCIGTDIYSGLPAPLVPFASWNATTGWDPVTGHGTPNFGKLMRIALEKASEKAPRPC